MNRADRSRYRRRSWWRCSRQGSRTRSSGRARRCRDPYPDTRYAHVDLTRIKTTLESCSKARRVARKAHWKALKLQPVGGRKTFIWNGWSVDGNIKPDHDRYVARKDGRQVRWRF